jgi:hypothetical protein
VLGLTLGWLSVVIAPPNILRAVNTWLFLLGSLPDDCSAAVVNVFFPQILADHAFVTEVRRSQEFSVTPRTSSKRWNFLAALQDNETNFIWHGKRVSHGSSLYRRAHTVPQIQVGKPRAKRILAAQERLYDPPIQRGTRIRVAPYGSSCDETDNLKCVGAEKGPNSCESGLETCSKFSEMTQSLGSERQNFDTNP